MEETTLHGMFHLAKQVSVHGGKALLGASCLISLATTQWKGFRVSIRLLWISKNSMKSWIRLNGNPFALRTRQQVGLTSHHDGFLWISQLATYGVAPSYDATFVQKDSLKRSCSCGNNHDERVLWRDTTLVRMVLRIPQVSSAELY